MHFQTVVGHALDVGATDIHLFSTPEGGHSRFRIHGELAPPQPLDRFTYTTLISTIKLHSGMDIGSTLPQDGRIRHNEAVDLRISTLPTSHGEDCAIRLLDRTQGHRSLNQLGLPDAFTTQLSHWTQLNAGLILVTGATGSGKSTTLYAMMTELMRTTRHCVVTLEDPIEYPIAGARQSQVNPGAGHTFASGLRAILRQDPDVIMIGEIRDKDTAQTALEAAFTGHLVLATLHTVNIRSTLQRLIQFGLDPFWLSQSIQGIMSQRLVPILDETGIRVGRKLDAELLSLTSSNNRAALIQGDHPEDATYLATS
jgi:type II secretory ATPase GspE/PulE/Tfp pilus assembly ATPase PilB-like protein